MRKFSRNGETHSRHFVMHAQALLEEARIRRKFQKLTILLKMILLPTFQFADETLFDAHLEDFKDIILLSREFITLEDFLTLRQGVSA